jgi:hypothetical protein
MMQFHFLGVLSEIRLAEGSVQVLDSLIESTLTFQPPDKLLPRDHDTESAKA